MPDEAGAAARNHDVEQSHKMQHRINGRAVRRLDELNDALRQARLRRRIGEQRTDGHIGAQGLFAAAQQHGVARLETESRRIGRHVWTRLVDDADDADGHAHATDFQPVRAHGRIVVPRHRVGQHRRLAQAFGHLVDAVLVEHEPIEIRVLKPRLPRVLEIEGIGFKNQLAAFLQRIGHEAQGLVLDARRDDGQLARCRLCRLCFLPHEFLDIHVRSSSFCCLTPSGPYCRDG